MPPPVPAVYEDSFWVVRTARGYFAEGRPGAGTVAPARIDAPLEEALRLDYDAAHNVASAGLEHHHEDWYAVPAHVRIEADAPRTPAMPSFYTLAGPTGEYMLAARTELNWAQCVEAAIRRVVEARRLVNRAPWAPLKLVEVVKLLIATHGLELVRAPRYYHIGHRSDRPAPPGE